MDKSEIKQLDRMIEVVMRSIPKERQARDVFREASDRARCEMAKVLFDKLSEQEEQHEAKLRATLEILKQELDEARGGVEPEKVICDTVHDTDLTDDEKARDLEQCMEVVMRMIPKERSARELYLSTSKSAKRDFTRTLFEWLADQEEQHESKLRGILDLLKDQLRAVREKH